VVAGKVWVQVTCKTQCQVLAQRAQRRKERTR
jgi:hypothetical protein